MKIKDLLLPAAVLGALALLAGRPSSSSPAPRVGGRADEGGGGYPYAYDYNTEIPVVPSEPGVSEGIPIQYNDAIPICPDMVYYPRPDVPLDDQMCCQCPGGWIHCGSEYSMRTQAEQGLMLAVCNL